MSCRIRDHEIGSPASQAYVANIVPLAIGAALGTIPGATSIDNTLRVIDPEPTDWVLLELIPEGFHRSIGHGAHCGCGVRTAGSWPPRSRPASSAPAITTAAEQRLESIDVDMSTIDRVLLLANVTKRLIDVDDEALDTAQVRLGTRTIKDTVNEALRGDGAATEHATVGCASALADADLDDRAAAWR